MQYTKEQEKDIEERINKAAKALDELQVGVSANMQANNMGNDTFGIKVVPFLSDTKYSNKDGVEEAEVKEK